MAKRSPQQLSKLRTERRQAAAEALRRVLRQRYPALPAQVWSNLGNSTLLGGAGAKALRTWLNSLRALTKSLD
jgi:hypothetical protein